MIQNSLTSHSFSAVIFLEFIRINDLRDSARCDCASDRIFKERRRGSTRPRRCKETKAASNDLLHVFSVIIGRIADILLAILQSMTSVVGVRCIHGTVQQ